MKVTAAVLHELGGELDLREVDLDPPGPDEVRVRVRATGVCASDVHVIDGGLPKPLPIVPGHEAAGVVAELGPGVDDLAVGDHVVLSILPWCGTCPACQRGERNACHWAGELASTGTLDGQATRLHLDGRPLHHFNGVSSWATQTVSPRSGVVKVPDAVPFTSAALLGCAVSTGVGAVRNAARVRPGETVAVLGCGGVGLSAVQGARMAGAGRVVAVDLDTDKLALARDLGATDVLDVSGGVDTAAALRELEPLGLDHVLECLGRPATIAAGWDAVGVGGQVTVCGISPPGSRLDLDAFGLISEKRLVGTYLGGVRTDVDVPALAADVLCGELDLDPMVEPIAFADLPDAVARLRRGGTLARRVVVLD